MKYMILSDQQRQTIIKAFQNGMKYKDIALAHNVSKRIVSNIVFRYKGRKDFKFKPKGGCNKKTKLLFSHKKDIVEWQTKDNQLTLKQLQTLLKEKYPNLQVVPSRSCLCKILKTNGITSKLNRIVPEERNSERTIGLRKQYADWFSKIAGYECLEHPIYIDETGYNLYLSKRKGRSPKGVPAIKRVKSITKGRNISACVAISPIFGIIHQNIYQGSFNGARFAEFIEELQTILIHFQLRNHYLIMDNAKIHHSKKAKEVAIPETFRYLPPYSPFLNPIENCFSKWKYLTKSKMENVKDAPELIQLMNVTIKEIKVEDCLAWYEHMKNYLPRSMDGVAIDV